MDERRMVLCAPIVRNGRNVCLYGKVNLHIKMLIPGWRKGTPDCVCGIRLITIHRNDSKGVWKAEDLALNEGICGKDCE